MRWDDLFADLEAQAAEQDEAGWRADVDELARAARSATTLADRLRAHRGQLRLVLDGGAAVEGRVADVGDGWVLVDAAPVEVLVPLAAVRSVTGLGRWAQPSTSPVRELGLAAVLRGLVRRRAAVVVALAGARPVSGTPDAVLGDHLEIAVHGLDVARRASAVTATAVVPLAAIVSVTLRP